MTKVVIRVAITPTSAIGPGKVRLLECVNESGSISAAARAMEMSYRRAWLLIDELNGTFKKPVVVASHGGRSGGGAKLTKFGHELVRRYRQIESNAHIASSHHLKALERASQRRLPKASARRALSN